MTGRWATFDCYGTLIDWNRGIAEALSSLWPETPRSVLLEWYHRLEPEVQAGGPLPYREVMAACTERIASELGLPLGPGSRATLAVSLPTWPPFPEVPGALGRLREDGWRLAVLSNTDPDLLTASLAAIGVPVDLTVTVREAGSYKPAPGHWQAFRALTGASPDAHVHVAASLFHDIAPCADLSVPAVWINRAGEPSDLPRMAELPDCRRLPEVLAAQA